MDAMRLRAEDVLYGLRLYRPARALYRFTPAGRQAAYDKESKRRFYSQLIRPGDLVFDVGANLGSYAEIFSQLGARVVALEPNPDCVSHIRRSYPGQGIEVINAAVGGSPAVATIRLADRSDMSSMSQEWIAAIGEAQGLTESLWRRQLAVPVITLDLLREKYGVPDFVKIDVEGFEENVLDGLTFCPPLLSFEFNTSLLAQGFRCLDKISDRADCVFNFVIGEPHRFELSEWVDEDCIRKRLASLPVTSGYGDIFVKRTRPEAAAGLQH